MFLIEFRNLVLTISVLNDVEKLDNFCAVLKPKVRLEILKAGPDNVNDATRIALNVYRDLFGTCMFSGISQYYGSQSMDIGNMQCSPENRRGSLRGNQKCRE